MDKIYVCCGSTGEYSDHIEWYVRAFADESVGRDFVEKCSARYREIKAEYGDNSWEIPENANEFDPGMQTDYTGTNYYLVEVPFDPYPYALIPVVG